MSVAVHPSSELSAFYTRQRARQPAGQAVSVLLLEPRRLFLASGRGPEPTLCFELELGAEPLLAQFFRHQPPTPGEMENAIMQVEDQLAHARQLAGEAGVLYGRGPLLLDVARAAGLNGDLPLHLTRDAVEQTFERLAMVSLGRPAGSDGLPQSAEFAAVLLILREVLHHLQFEAIQLG